MQLSRNCNPCMIWQENKNKNKNDWNKREQEVHCFQISSHGTHKYNILRQVIVHQQTAFYFLFFSVLCSGKNVFTGVQTLYRANWHKKIDDSCIILKQYIKHKYIHKCQDYISQELRSTVQFKCNCIVWITLRSSYKSLAH
jgi:L-lactate permease